MSTRSFIAKHLGLGKFVAVYCHFDGYPEKVGQQLLDHWTDEKKLIGLFELGCLSVLGDEIGEKHNFNEHNYWEGKPYKANSTYVSRTDCLFYHRDRGDEKGWRCLEVNSFPELIKEAKDSGADYLYIFDVVHGDIGLWQYACLIELKDWTEVDLRPLKDWRKHEAEERAKEEQDG